MKNRKCFAFIFARGGSKGIPGKNRISFAGKPLIAYSIEMAMMCTMIDRTFVSTDDEKIAAIAKKYGAEIPFIRPAELAQDNSDEWKAWQHAIQFFMNRGEMSEQDVFVALPPTSPLRSVEDVERCITLLETSEADIVITVQEANRNPYYNMITIDENGISNLVMPTEKKIDGRQQAPKVYDITTVAYVTTPNYILKSDHVFGGRVKSVIIPAERAIDIDTLLDLKIAEFLMKESSK